MTLLLTESDMLKLFEDMTEAEVVAGATEWVRKAFVEQASGDLRMHPRVHVDYPEDEGYEHGCDIRIMPSIVPGLGAAGFRFYPDHHGGKVLDASRKTAVLDFQVGTELLVLYDFHDSMKLLAIMSHVFLMNARVAAPTALSVRYLSKEDSSVLGFFGAGRLAGAQIRGVLNEREINEVRLCSRTPERRDELARKLRAETSARIVTLEDPRDVVEGSDIIVTCTNAGKPVFDGSYVEPGMHITQIARGEIDETTVRKSKVFTVWNHQILFDTPPMQPYGNMVDSGELKGDKVYELSDVVSGKIQGRESEKTVTLCATQGTGVMDVAMGKWAYELAVEKGVGRSIEFLDI